MPDPISNSSSYQDLLASLKQQIRTAQVRAVLAVNKELVLLYWHCPASCWTITLVSQLHHCGQSKRTRRATLVQPGSH
jgi:hypothetical protein